MSNLYDSAHGLSKAIKESEEFQALVTAQEKVNEEDTSKKMLQDFREMQMELQMKQMQGQQLSEEEIQKANSLFETIKLNPTISSLLEAEQRLSVVMEDINKIIAEPLKEIYGDDEEQENA
ncbi:YlbF family regulator [Caldalkalibacillus salinus]|uniref:YlbF family regulator n=1 Tax=Caldalkalibacillus salinus TaxID=2803787 RepID=UPI0019231482|nr:YlbF family regulator [Caldalkalibacillus salinus]